MASSFNLFADPAIQQQISRNNLLAQSLQQQASQPLEGQMVSNHYISPSWTQGLAKLMQGYTSNQLNDNSDKMARDQWNSQRDMMLKSLQDNNSQQPSPALNAAAPNLPNIENNNNIGGVEPSVSNSQALNSTPQQTPEQIPQQIPQQFSNQPTSSNNFGLANLLKANSISQIGGDSAASSYWKQFEPTDLEKELRLAGIDPRSAQGQAYITNKLSPPIISRGDGVLVADTANPGSYKLAPGSIDALTSVNQAKQGVENQNTLVSVPQPDGTTKQMTKAQALQLTNPIPQGVGSSVLNQFTPKEQALIQNDANKNGINNYNVEYKQSNGQVNNGNINAVNSTPGFSSGQSTSGKVLQEEQGKNAGELEAKINSDANSSVAKIAQNNKMINLIPEITTGPLSKQITTLKMLGNSLGINIGDPSSNQEFEKYAIKGALEGAKQIYGSRLTNQDVNSQIASNPGSSMAEKALYQLIKYDTIIQQRNLDKQKAYFEYEGPKNQFEMNFNQNNPLFGVSAPSNGQDASQSAPSAPIPVTKTLTHPKLKPNSNGSFDYMGR